MKKIQCESCGASGIYRGMSEMTFGPGGDQGGYAVVCWTCHGKGYRKAKTAKPGDKPFTKLVRRNWCTQVGASGGGFFPKECEPVTYADFLAGKLPGPPKNPKQWRVFDSRKGEIT